MKDFHIHSGLIDHTHDDILSLASKAKELGFSEITILEHISPFKIRYPGNSDPSNTIFVDSIPSIYPRRTSTISELVAQCKHAESVVGIKVHRSLEVDYFSCYESDISGYKNLDLDHLTLSCHYVEDEDAPKDSRFIHIGFKENLDYYLRKYGKQKLYESYYQNQLKGVKSNLFKVVAHLDFFGRYLDGYKPEEAMEFVEPVLVEIIKRNMILEINLAKIDPNPGMLLYNKYKELGGNNTCLSSDAHSIKDLETSISKRDLVLQSMQIDTI